MHEVIFWYWYTVIFWYHCTHYGTSTFRPGRQVVSNGLLYIRECIKAIKLLGTSIRSHDCCPVSRYPSHSLRLQYGIRNLQMNELQYSSRGIGSNVTPAYYSTVLAT
jgi:hypothetical protein